MGNRWAAVVLEDEWQVFTIMTLSAVGGQLECDVPGDTEVQ